MERKKKSASVSRTEQTYLIMPPHLNAAGRLFGGQLLEWIDMTAGIVAHRHGDCAVVTACIDHLEFHASAFATDVVTLIGTVTYTGRTSMEVKVDTYRENRGGEKSLINRAYLVMVGLEDDLKTTKEIPELEIESYEQQAEWEAAVKRNEMRKLRRKEGY